MVGGHISSLFSFFPSFLFNHKAAPGKRSTRVAVFCMSSVASGCGGHRFRSCPSTCPQGRQSCHNRSYFLTGVTY